MSLDVAPATSVPAPAVPELPSYVLGPGEAAAVRELVAAEPVDLPAVADLLALRAHELPRPLRAFLLGFRLRETAPACLVRGLPVPADLGPTPASPDAPRSEGARAAERTLALVAALLGDVFGWAHEQDGRLVHDVAPQPGHEQAQAGSSSAAALAWHTEEAFDGDRADYVSLFCLRNPDAVATTLASVDDVALDPAVAAVLRRPFARYLPELSFTGAGAAGPPAAPLFGADDAPYLRVDPVYVDLGGASPAERDAYGALCAALDAALRPVVLAPGDLLVVDNYRAVHGRRAFRARFDGTDRWLLRANVSRDLRRSRARRPAAGSRVLA